jgi:hypothetical protein
VVVNDAAACCPAAAEPTAVNSRTLSESSAALTLRFK